MKSFLSLGSNLGNRKLNISIAIKNLETVGKVVRSSQIYETEPWGFDAENNFFNSVVIFETDLKPQELLAEIKKIEKKMGRIKTQQNYESRIIDIDIIFYNNFIYQSKELTIPHKFAHKRDFVLEPLNELVPTYIHPVFNLTISELLYNLKSSQMGVQVQ